MLVLRGLILVWCCLLELGRAGNPRARLGPAPGNPHPWEDGDFTSCRFQASLSWSHLLDKLQNGITQESSALLEVSLDGKPVQNGLTCTLSRSNEHLSVRHLLGTSFTDEIELLPVEDYGKLRVPVGVLVQIITGSVLRCGDVVSCIRVNAGWKDARQFWSEVKLLEDPLVKETHPEVGRHLLALNENMEFSGELVFSPLFTFLCALVAALLLILAVAMCVCKDTTVRSTPGEIPLKEITPQNNRKSAASNKSQLTVTSDEREVKLEIEGSNRHSNGSVIRDSVENGRPRSHDQRALPAIPPVNAAGGVGQTDDEDEDEGHYDTINRGRHHPPPSKSPPVPSAPQTAAPRVQNLYEQVDDDRDSTYAGVKDSNSADPGFASARSTNPYAVVDGIGNAEYAHIDEKRAKRNSPLTNASVQRVQAMGVVMKASTETLDSYSSIPPPPVPDKHFDSDDQANASPNSSLAAPSPTPDRSNNSSPSLPPRNGSTGHSEASQTYNTNTVVVGNPGVAMTTAPAGASIISVNQDVVDGSTGPAGTAKKEPRYSSVTARESLANLRERQAQFVTSSSQGNGTLDSNDTTYETVNYDEIKTPNSMSGNPSQGNHADRQSLSSDLYAEIASGSGENSARSSTYARVGDIHAPTPPPLEILKKLSVPPEGDDEMPDPGYSMIRRNRPVSAFPSVSGNSSHTSREPVREQLYAVVDKSKKNRNTVHIVDGPGAGVNSHIVAGPQQELYAVVQKPRRGRSPVGPGEIVPLEYIGTGARPKVWDNGVATPPNGNPKVGSGPALNQSTSRSESSSSSAITAVPVGDKDDSDYTTIGSVGKSEEDPDYDNIADPVPAPDTTLEKDSNYEMVRTAENVTRVRISPGVATEIVPGSDSNPHGLVHIGDQRTRNPVWQRRDHIYQEISDAQREKEQLMLQGTGSERPMSTSL